MAHELKTDTLHVPFPQSISMRQQLQTSAYTQEAKQIPENFCFSEKDIAPLQWRPLLYFRLHIYLICILLLVMGIYLYLSVSNAIYITSQNISTDITWVSYLNMGESLGVGGQILQLHAILMTVVIAILGTGILLISIFGRSGVDKLLVEEEVGRHSPHGFAALCKFDKVKNFSEEEVINMVRSWWHVEKTIDPENAPLGELDQLIEKIIFFYNTPLFDEIRQEIEQLEHRKKILQDENLHQDTNKHSISFSQKNSTFQLMNKFNRLESLKERIKNEELDKTNKCLVIFKSEAYAEFFLNKNKSRVCGEHINRPILPGEIRVKVQDPPFPGESYYDKQHYRYLQTNKNKCFNRFLTWTAFIIITSGLGLSAGFGLSIGATDSSSSVPWNLLFALVFMLILMIAAFLAVKITSKYEIEPSKKHEQSSIFVKKILSFITICIIGVSLPISVLSNTSQISATLSEIIFILALILSLVFPFYLICNYQALAYICRKQEHQIRLNTEAEAPLHLESSLMTSYHRYMKSNISNYKTSLQTFRQTKQTFEKLKLLEPHQFKFGQQSSWLCYTFIIFFFYASFLPILIPLLLLGLVQHYLLSRVALVKFSSGVYPGGAHQYHKIVSVLALSPFACSLGNIYFHLLLYLSKYLTRTDFPTQTIVITGVFNLIFSVSMLIAINVINFHKNSTPKTTLFLYKQCVDYFQFYSKNVPMYSFNQYQFQNPIYDYIETNFPKHQKNKKVNGSIQHKKLLIEELNTMSKSLEESLKERLFSRNHIFLEDFTKRPQQIDDSVYFEYEQKIQMPVPKANKTKVPPIFKLSQQDMLLEKKLAKQKRKISESKPMMKFNELFVQEDSDDQNMKNVIKEKIKEGITRIK